MKRTLRLPSLLLAALPAAGRGLEAAGAEEGRVEARKSLFEKTLLSVEKNIHVGEWSLIPDDLPGRPASAAGWSIQKAVLHGGKQEGVDVIVLNNGRMTVRIIPTRGMEVWEARCGDLRLGWDSPVKEVVHPAQVNLQARGGLG
ncbi:MAG: DUF4432 family protein, partial [Anaerolineales bacterium]